MKVSLVGNTNPGQVRKNNEDNYSIIPELNLVIVADGMGGHNAGEVASEVTVSTIKEYFKENFELIDHLTPCELIKKSIILANRKVYTRAQNNKAERGMGTTIVVMLLYKNKAFIGWVGDSRAYISRIENGKRFMSQISQDHSLVQEQINDGLITQKDADRYNIKDMITKAVGFAEEVTPSCKTIKTIKKGDIFMACSDGYYRYFNPKQIADSFSKVFYDNLVDSMIESAYDAGGEDNITVATIKVKEV